MSDKNSSRLIINLLGIPSLLGIIIIGDDSFGIPIFSIFIIVVLLLGIKEMPILVKKMNGEPALPILVISILILQINRMPCINWQIPIHDLLIMITLFAMIIEIFRKKITPILNICTIVFTFIWFLCFHVLPLNSNKLFIY